MTHRIWVIEAPGKRAAFLDSLGQAGFTGDGILATYGRLFDLPSDELGFDPSIIIESGKSTQIKWLPRKPDQVKKLVRLLSDATEVLIATDSDLEGELIASQVHYLCTLAQEKASHRITTSRVHIRSITPQGIKHAFDRKTVIEANIVRAAKSRRVLDRILGYLLHDEDDSWRLSMGRVISPLVYSLKQRPAETSIIRKALPDGWSAIFRVRSNQEKRKDTLVSLLSSLPSPALAITHEEKAVREFSPLTGAEALSMCMRSLSHSPSEIHSAIQRNYERGRLSYPRTDSRRLEQVGLKWIERAAQRHGIEFSSDVAVQKQGEADERSYDAHEALLPSIDDIPDVNIGINRMSTDEAVLSVIASHSMRIGEKAQEYRKEIGSLSGDSASQSWRKSLSGWMDEMEIVRITDSEGRVIDPMIFILERDPDLVQADIQVWKHSVELIVVERLMEIGLGRPSTLMQIAQKAKAQYLDEHGAVNGRAHIMIEKMMQRLPSLLKEEVARPLEVAITSIDEKQTIAQRLSRAWDILDSPRFITESGSIGPSADKNTENKNAKSPSSQINYSNY